MIKVPATEAGVPAIEELTARGVNVNVTLLFAVARYEQVIDAYMSGLERRLASGDPVHAIASVASFFVSRVDAKIDPLLPAGSSLGGRVAIANARLAYARYLDRFSEDPCLADDRWLTLRDSGARPQRPLWASTGTKNPAYSDVLYVEKLITRDAANTMPEATLRAFADHGADAESLSASREVMATMVLAEQPAPHGFNPQTVASECPFRVLRSRSGADRGLSSKPSWPRCGRAARGRSRRTS